MKFSFFLTVLCVLFLSLWSPVHAQNAWWQLCNSCQTESDFVQSAVSAPGSHELVYVSNRLSNVTYKFDRFFTREDIDGGYVYMTHVTHADFPASEKAIFESVIEDSQRIYAPIDRSVLDGLAPIGSPNSVAGDLTDGFINQGMMSAISLWLEWSGHLPDRGTVNEELGLDLGDLGFLVGQSEELRTKVLTVRIQYPDGSYLQFSRQPDGTLNNWTASDSAGNQVVLAGSAVHEGRFGDNAPYEFGPGGDVRDAVIGMIEALQTTHYRCSMEDRPNGAVRVTCIRL